MSTPAELAPRPRAIVPLRQRVGAAGHDLLPRPLPPAHGPHAVVLRGLAAERGLGPAQPTLVARTEDDFVAGVQALLAEQGGAARLADAMALLPRDAQGHFKFYPPVQRVHQLVLVEACCAEPGFPRLDPRAIDSAGMVLRRPVVDAGHPLPSWLAWQRRGEQPVGWVPLAARPGPGVVAELDEPDALRRPPHERTGNAHVDAQLQALVRRRSASPVAHTPPSERVVPLHVLPEALCAALGRTLLLGYVPVATDEVVDSSEPSRAAPGPAEVQDLQNHLMHYLRAGPLKPLPRADEPVHPGWLDTISQAPDGTGDTTGTPAVGRWVQTLMQLHLEFDLTASGPEAAGLQQAFAAYRVVRVSAAARDAAGTSLAAWMVALCRASPLWSAAQAAQALPVGFEAGPVVPLVNALFADWLARGRPRLDPTAWLGSETDAQVRSRIQRLLAGTTVAPALDFVRAAVEVLLGDATPAQALVQPDFWAEVSPTADAAFAAAAAARVHQREAAMFSGAGKRLSEPGTPLAVRCFLRLKSPAGCPPTLVWSASSATFSVAPWWEAGGAKPRVIDMPDPFDRRVLRQLKPSIGFAMPGRLGQLMSPANLDKLKDGKKPSEGGGIGVDWLCGFNIPIITLCALLVLNIFLQLMNIIFWWLPFVKICLPIPRKK